MISNDKPSRAESPAVHTLLLHPDDTVLVCIRTIAPGDALIIDQSVVQAAMPVPVGHKVARQALKPGDRVLKYGVPIGSVTKAVNAGDHVHSHNMQSDYIPSHSRSHSHNPITDESQSLP